MTTRPVLILNPRDDLQFAAFAEELAGEGELDAAELQGRLRGRYPKAIVRPRDLSSRTIIGTNRMPLEWRLHNVPFVLTVPRKARMIGVYRCLACPTGGP